MKNFVDKISEQSIDGTIINRANLMAAQGFNNYTFEYLSNGIRITYSYPNNITEIMTITYDADSIIETFVADGKTIVKTSTLVKDTSGGTPVYTGGYEVTLS